MTKSRGKMLGIGARVRGGLLSLGLSTGMLLFNGAQAAEPVRAPEFSHTKPEDWINSSPLTLAQLRGKVVLLEFWTSECVNCLRSAQWIQSISGQKTDGRFVVIGVHTPELPEERSIDTVRSTVQRLQITYPVMVDNDYSYWRAVGNQY